MIEFINKLIRYVTYSKLQRIKNLYKICSDASIAMAGISYSGQCHLLGIIEGAKRFSEEYWIKQLRLGVFSTVGDYIFQMLPGYLVADHVFPSEGGDK